MCREKKRGADLPDGVRSYAPRVDFVYSLERR